MATFNTEHLKVLADSKAGSWQGRVAGKWASDIGHDLKITKSEILEAPLSRIALSNICQDANVSTLDLCVIIFAWGGMRVDHGRRILQETEWQQVSETLRDGSLDHQDAYSQFHSLTQAKKMKGCGPAYYTKLLMFLPPNGKRGIIMDQWTARSVNLLTGKEVVRMARNYGPTKTYRVAKENDASVYQEFCRLVAELAKVLNCSIEETELRLFSEGRGKGRWRNYLKKQG